MIPISQTFLIGTAIVSMFSTTLAGDCSNKGPFALEGKYFGQKKGGERNIQFCDSAWEKGIVITGMECWSNQFHVHGIQFFYSDGTKGPMHGAPTNEQNRHVLLDWGMEDRITKLQMWNNWGGGTTDAVGRIQIETKNGKKGDCGSDVGNSSGEPVMTNSGIILGAKGSSSAFVNNLQILFMESAVDKAEITSAKFDDKMLEQMNKEKKGIESTSLSEVIILNTDEAGEKDWSFENQEEKSVDVTKEFSTTEMFGVKVGVSVSAGIQVPLFSASTQISTETSYSKETFTKSTTAEHKKHILKWSEKSTETSRVGPGRAIWCKATASSGTFDGAFEMTTTLTLKGGKTFTMTGPGKYHSVGWSSATSNCRNIPVEEAPGGVPKKEADGKAIPVSKSGGAKSSTAIPKKGTKSATVEAPSPTTTAETPESTDGGDDGTVGGDDATTLVEPVISPTPTKASSVVAPEGTFATRPKPRTTVKPPSKASITVASKPTVIPEPTDDEPVDEEPATDEMRSRRIRRMRAASVLA